MQLNEVTPTVGMHIISARKAPGTVHSVDAITADEVFQWRSYDVKADDLMLTLMWEDDNGSRYSRIPHSQTEAITVDETPR